MTVVGAVVPDVVALAAAVAGPDVGVGARRRPGCLRDKTLTNAYSISDENTKTRQTIIQMSIA